MNNLFSAFLFNVVSIVFPTLIYMIFFSFKDHFKDGENDVALDICLIFSLFIIYYFCFIIKVDDNLFSLFIPILIAFIFNKVRTSILISFICYFIIYEMGDFSFYFFILLAFYFLIYYIYYKRNKTKLFLTNCFSIATILFIILYYFINNLDYLDCIFYIFIYLISIYTIYFLINKANNIINLYNSLKDIEDNKILKTTIFKVTHEIKNPLAVMKGYLSLFDINDKVKIKKYVNILKTEVDNALLVLKDFSDINNLNINKQEIDFNKLLLEIKETVFPFFNDKSISYLFKSEDDIIINADYDKLKQVFINLIKNSIEACDKYGKIELNSYKTDKYLFLSIKDNGCGMDKDMLDNIFTPFYTKKKYGTGLGLCLSKEIIEGHGGSIKYFSTLGKSTTVKIILPI